jgi:hypothetical protein
MFESAVMPVTPPGCDILQHQLPAHQIYVYLQVYVVRSIPLLLQFFNWTLIVEVNACDLRGGTRLSLPVGMLLPAVACG